MQIFKKRVWTITELGCLKWSSILFGMILGAYFAELVLANVWLFILGFVALAIKPIFKQLIPDNSDQGHSGRPAGASN
ncbi:MAG TPA: hypothetical protein PLJ47_17370 [Candidatus Hydrogenedentes bacterium]|mgnify:FL=1|nr:hypothetical protein [Candidatus Hydrogenedentota bacterium]